MVAAGGYYLYTHSGNPEYHIYLLSPINGWPADYQIYIGIQSDVQNLKVLGTIGDSYDTYDKAVNEICHMGTPTESVVGTPSYLGFIINGKDYAPYDDRTADAISKCPGWNYHP